MKEATETIMGMIGLKDKACWANSCNVNLSQTDKECVAWHSDNEATFQGMNRNIIIVSLSLGTSRLFEVLRKADTFDSTITQVTLDAGDIVVMEGWFQENWQHRLQRQVDLDQARVNIAWWWAVPGGGKVKANKTYPVWQDKFQT